MRLRHVTALLALSAGLSAQPHYYSVPPVDAPELAPRGRHAVGVRTIEIVHPGQPDILNFNKETKQAPLYDRTLKVEVWYPAIIPPGQQESTVYESAMPGNPEHWPAGLPTTFQTAGKALRDAAPAGGPYPLVIVSHGYPGSRTLLTYLTENLASKGYIVAAIDHTDSVFGAVKPFPSTLLNRSADQFFTIQALAERAQKPGDFLHGIVDPTNTAIIGYSMGGYGALASAGAGYNPKGAATQFVPGDYMKDWLAGAPKFESIDRKNIKAVVAIAPWGAQPPYNVWDEQGLAGIHIPLLFIAGDQDDISNYKLGVKPAFERAVNSDRCMLVYENANHNVGPNPAPDAALTDFRTREMFDEPVWRKDRLMAINEHFITAFLDLYLKGDQAKRSYLHLAVEKSNDGAWPLKQGESVGGAFSSGDKYWKGFQRRWALGLEMHCYAPGQPAK